MSANNNPPHPNALPPQPGQPGAPYYYGNPNQAAYYDPRYYGHAASVPGYHNAPYLVPLAAGPYAHPGYAAGYAVPGAYSPQASAPYSVPQSYPKPSESAPQFLPWFPGAAQQQQIEKWFGALDKEGVGQVGGSNVVQFLSQSHLPKDTLREIWSLVDSQKTGRLNRGQFSIVMRLVGVLCSPIYRGARPSVELFNSTLQSEVEMPRIGVEEGGREEKDGIEGAAVPPQVQPPLPAQALPPQPPPPQALPPQALPTYPFQPSPSLTPSPSGYGGGYYHPASPAQQPPLPALQEKRGEEEEEEFSDFAIAPPTLPPTLLATLPSPALSKPPSAAPPLHEEEGEEFGPLVSHSEDQHAQDNKIIVSEETRNDNNSLNIVTDTRENQSSAPTQSNNTSLPPPSLPTPPSSLPLSSSASSLPLLSPALSSNNLHRLSVFDEMVEEDMRREREEGEDWGGFTEALPTPTNNKDSVNPFDLLEEGEGEEGEGEGETHPVPLPNSISSSLLAPSLPSVQDGEGEGEGVEKGEREGVEEEWGEEEDFGDFSAAPAHSNNILGESAETVREEEEEKAQEEKGEDGEDFGDFSSPSLPSPEGEVNLLDLSPLSPSAVPAPLPLPSSAGAGQGGDLLDLLSDDPPYLPPSSSSSLLASALSFDPFAFPSEREALPPLEGEGGFDPFSLSSPSSPSSPLPSSSSPPPPPSAALSPLSERELKILFFHFLAQQQYSLAFMVRERLDRGAETGEEERGRERLWRDLCPPSSLSSPLSPTSLSQDKEREEVKSLLKDIHSTCEDMRDLSVSMLKTFQQTFLSPLRPTPSAPSPPSLLATLRHYLLAKRCRLVTLSLHRLQPSLRGRLSRLVRKLKSQLSASLLSLEATLKFSLSDQVELGRRERVGAYLRALRGLGEGALLACTTSFEGVLWEGGGEGEGEGEGEGVKEEEVKGCFEVAQKVLKRISEFTKGKEKSRLLGKTWKDLSLQSSLFSPVPSLPPSSSPLLLSLCPLTLHPLSASYLSLPLLSPPVPVKHIEGQGGKEGVDCCQALGNFWLKEVDVNFPSLHLFDLARG